MTKYKISGLLGAIGCLVSYAGCKVWDNELFLIAMWMFGFSSVCNMLTDVIQLPRK